MNWNEGHRSLFYDWLESGSKTFTDSWRCSMTSQDIELRLLFGNGSSMEISGPCRIEQQAELTFG